jgi:hypothetical protein
MLQLHVSSGLVESIVCKSHESFHIKMTFDVDVQVVSMKLKL